MMLTFILAIAVPATFLYVLHWLDLYGSDRPRLVVACVGWGLLAFLLSFLANRFCIDILGLSRSFVGTRTAPFVEEVFKAGVLIYLVRRRRFSYFIDGAIYGFASGIGFAMIENLRYVQLYPDNPLSLVVVRDFSSALAHGTATAMTGVALARWAAHDRKGSALPALAFGLACAMTLHYAWNNFAFFSPLSKRVTEWVLVSVGLLGVAAVGATILYGLRSERRRLHETLGMKLRVSEEESNLIQHMGDLDHLLHPIDRWFGRAKRKQVARLLHIEAQIGLKQDARQRTTDAALSAELDEDIRQLETALDAARQDVGVYVMLFVRSIFPATAWSLWTRLGQALVDRPVPRVHIWKLAPGPGAAQVPETNMYERLRAIVAERTAARTRASSHLEALPLPMRRCLEWAVQTTRVTVGRAASELGHEEEVAHALLSELVTRGLVHRKTKDGETVFEVMRHVTSTTVHLWHRARSPSQNR